MRQITLQTTKCIVTGKEATCWTGHVVAVTQLPTSSRLNRTRLAILAGFVDSDTCAAAERVGSAGHFGEWKPEFGIEVVRDFDACQLHDVAN